MSETKETVYKGQAPSGAGIVIRMIGTTEGVIFCNTSIGGMSIVTKPGETLEFELKVAYPSQPYYTTPPTPQINGVNVIINQPAPHITNTYDLEIKKITINDV